MENEKNKAPVTPVATGKPELPPKKHVGFFHKVGHVAEEVALAAVEVPLEIALSDKIGNE